MKLLTIFTPTFNRKSLLERVYLSLVAQTQKDFIWLIVDDGSDDNTKEYVEKIKKENIINIEYIFQENQGKMQAHNTGVLNCNTKYFVCLDSDDTFTPYAVEKILENINKTNNDKCAGIIAYKCVTDNKKDLLCLFPNVEYSSLCGLYDKGFKGETTIIFKTNVLKQFLFPKFYNEKFVTEVVVYDRIDRHYIYFILEEIITIYEYQDSGLSNSMNRLIINNPIGFMECWRQRFFFSCQDKNITKIINSCINYICFSFNAHKYTIRINNQLQLLIVILLYPLGLLKFIYLLIKRR